MKTLILSDGLDGHYNQSIGIAAILQETTLPSYKVVEVKLKFTFLRGLQYTYIKLLSKNLTNTNIKIILKRHPLLLYNCPSTVYHQSMSGNHGRSGRSQKYYWCRYFLRFSKITP